MKKGKLMILFELVIFLSIVSSVFTAQTLARYKTEISGYTSLTVAEFNFSATTANTEYSKTDTAEIPNIFSYIDENDLVAAGVIAPGASGHFNIELDNSTSEVAVVVSASGETYIPNLNKKVNIPIKYKVTVDGVSSAFNKNINDSFKEVFTENGLALGFGENTSLGENKKTVTIDWKWPSSNNTADSVMGDLAKEAALKGENFEIALKLEIDTTQYEG